jgi:hypothetical protein
MAKNLDKINDILAKDENITKDDFKEIQRLFPLLDYREQGIESIIMGKLERLWLSKLIDFKPTQLAFDP